MFQSANSDPDSYSDSNLVSEVETKYNVRYQTQFKYKNKEDVFFFRKDDIDVYFNREDIAEVSYGLIIGKEKIVTDKIDIYIGNSSVKLECNCSSSGLHGFHVRRITLPYDEFVAIIRCMDKTMFSENGDSLYPELVTSVSNHHFDFTPLYNITLECYLDTGNVTEDDSFFVVTFSKVFKNAMKFRFDGSIFNSDGTSLQYSTLYYQTEKVCIKPDAYESGQWYIEMLRADDIYETTIIKLKKADVDSLIKLYNQLRVKCGRGIVFPPKPEVVKDEVSDETENNNDNVETEETEG